MAGAAVDAGVGLAVTSHTFTHRELLFPVQADPAAYWPVTNIALGSSLCVLAVTEAHESWDLINPNPIYVPILLCERSQFLFTARPGRDGGMARHAFRHAWHVD
jgi:hypothetical protein